MKIGCYRFIVIILGVMILNNGVNADTIVLATIDKKSIYQPGSPVRLTIDQFVEKHLPDFQLNYVEMTFERYWAMAQNNQDVCNLFAIPHPNDRNTIASTVSTFRFPAPSIIMLKSVAEKHQISKNESVQNILSNQNLFGGYAAGRRFHYQTSKFIQQLISDQKATMFKGHFTLRRLHKMTKEGRIDYFIGSLAEVSMVSKMEIDQFVQFSFKEFLPAELKIVCNDSAKNRAFIAAFEDNIKYWYQQPALPSLWSLLHLGANSQSYSEYVKQQMDKK